MTDVSVIIPTFNRLSLLQKAIESCRGTKCQTEIIVVDDGGNDGTWEWLQSQTDVHSYRQHNQGQTYAVNHGLRNATGKYVRFLDDDDFLEPGIIDRQFEAANASAADLVYSRVDTYELETGEIRKNQEAYQWDDFLSVQLGREYGSHFLGMLFRTDLAIKVPRRPEFALREDRMFLLEVGLLDPKICYIEGNAGYWVSHPNQMQGNYFGMKSDVANWQTLMLYRQILARLDSSDYRTSDRIVSACKVLWPLAHWIAKKHLEDAAQVAEWIKLINPDFQQPETGLLGWLYSTIGFRNTELILRLRRSLLSPLKNL